MNRVRISPKQRHQFYYRGRRLDNILGDEIGPIQAHRTLEEQTDQMGCHRCEEFAGDESTRFDSKLIHRATTHS
jgi:hypothetical protein